MRYADTCLLVSLFLRDVGTEAALEWIQGAGSAPVALSHWSMTEFASAVGMRARAGHIDENTHGQALARFRRFVATRLTLLAPDAADFDHAGRLLERYASGLRAGDALHLAICANRGLNLHSADKGFVRAAIRLGLAAELVA